MSFSILKEMNTLIMKFSKVERRELIDYFIKNSLDIIKEKGKINKKQMILILNLCLYIKKESKSDFLNHCLSTKILNMRALILDLIESSYEGNKWSIYRPEKWIEKIIKDINESFMIVENYEKLIENVKTVEVPGEFKEIINLSEFLNTNIMLNEIRVDENEYQYEIKDLVLALKIYNKKLVEEFSKIFLGTDHKYGKGGNQLLLNFMYYSDQLSLIDDKFEEFLNKIKANINSKDLLSDDELKKIYKEYMKKKRKEKKTSIK